MSIERMFEMVDGLRGTASADAAFGEPEQVNDRVFIPVANVRVGFGMGFGQGPAEEELAEETEQGESSEEKILSAAGSEGASPEGGGAGGHAKARPVAVIEVTPEDTIVRPIVDESKVALAGVLLVGWVVFVVAVTVRAVLRPGGNQ